jgi:hypothetical protein
LPFEEVKAVGGGVWKKINFYFSSAETTTEALKIFHPTKGCKGRKLKLLFASNFN